MSPKDGRKENCCVSFVRGRACLETSWLWVGSSLHMAFLLACFMSMLYTIRDFYFQVEYQCEGFLEKNQDTVYEEQIKVLKSSKVSIEGFFLPWYSRLSSRASSRTQVGYWFDSHSDQPIGMQVCLAFSLCESPFLLHLHPCCSLLQLLLSMIGLCGGRGGGVSFYCMVSNSEIPCLFSGSKPA